MFCAPLLAKFTKLQNEARALDAQHDALDAAGRPARLSDTDDVDALIQIAAVDHRRGYQ